MADFIDISDFLLPTNPKDSTAINLVDSARVLIQSQMPKNLKELVCNILAGNGFLLPNLQICLISIIEKFINSHIDKLQTKLTAALQKVQASLNALAAHLNIDNVLNRLNSLSSKLSQVASMINFCAGPVSPFPITSVLENAMQSLLGKGLDFLNRIGTIPKVNLGGCLTGDGFNPNIFDGGILQIIGDNFQDTINGNLPDNLVTSIVTELDDVSTGIDTMINEENCVEVVEELGGSAFAESAPDLHEGVGVFHNPNSVGFSGSVSIAYSLKNAYERLAAYPVVDDFGNSYDNIFQLFVDEPTLNLLRSRSESEPVIQERTPVYDYCGTIIGYTTTIVQGDQDTSDGTPPYSMNYPGENANGLDTSGGANPCYVRQETEELSDARVKENITDIQDPLRIVQNLEGKYFNIKGQEKRRVGLIAQNAQEHLPEIVSQDENGLLHVNYGNTIGVLIEAIKSQQETINRLEEKIDRLSSQN